MTNGYFDVAHLIDLKIILLHVRMLTVEIFHMKVCCLSQTFRGLLRESDFPKLESYYFNLSQKLSYA